MLLGLTNLGIVHTLISLVAVAAGILLLWRDREISMRSTAGRLYVWGTALTCLTGFGIFQHGGFGKPHVLGIVTLLVLALAVLAERGLWFGSRAKIVSAIAYSTTFFFHMIPGFTETLTRLPPAAPVFAGPEDPGLQKVIGVVFVLFLIGAVLQYRRLRGAAGPR